VFGILLLNAALAGDYQPRDGDVLLQTSRSEQSLAIQLATGSPYSHVGVVLHVGGVAMVYEAVEPVRVVPLAGWTASGEGGHFTALRLASDPEGLAPEAAAALKATLDGWIGLHYDPWFGWGDDRLYCSELVWKGYERALDVTLGEPGRIRDFDLSHPAVQQKLAERYGAAVPMDEPVVPPSALVGLPALMEVYSSYPGR